MAKRVKSQAKQKEQATRFLAKVPEEKVFWAHDGNVFKDLKELAEGLTAMTDETFAYHSAAGKKDFCNWVRDVIQDEELANDLVAASDRAEAAVYVNARVTVLSSRLN
jgi:hypothetical protein